VKEALDIFSGFVLQEPISTVSELSFVYVQWNQAVTLLPVIEACEFVTLQTPLALMQ
jgi:hypothetical protein